MRITRLLPMLLLVGAVHLPAAGQVFNPPPPPIIHMPDLIWHHFMMNQIRSNALASSMFLEAMIGDLQALYGQVASAGGVPDRVTSLPSKTATGRRDHFPPELAFPASGYSLLARKLAREDPSQDEATLESFFSGVYRGYRTAFRDEHERLGMPLEDLGAALTAYIVLSYMSAHALDGIPSEHSLAVYDQAADILLANEELPKMTEADKELLAETLVVLGSMPNLAFQQSRDEGERRRMALENLERLFGEDADALRITDAGIVR